VDAALVGGAAASVALASDLVELGLAAETSRGRAGELDAGEQGLACRSLLVAVEVDEEGVEPVAGGSPLVLLDEDDRLHGRLPALVEPLRERGGERLDERGDRADRLDAGLGVADANLDRAEPGVRPQVPQMYVGSGNELAFTARSTSSSNSSKEANAGGIPVRGKLSKIFDRADARPVSRPRQNGELADSARSSGSQVRRPPATRIACCPVSIPTWTWRPKISCRSAVQRICSIRSTYTAPAR